MLPGCLVPGPGKDSNVHGEREPDEGGVKGGFA